MKRVPYYYAIITSKIEVPATFQTATRLPGNPQGNERVGFAAFRRELLTVAMQDRLAGGKPVLKRIDPPFTPTPLVE